MAGKRTSLRDLPHKGGRKVGKPKGLEFTEVPVCPNCGWKCSVCNLKNECCLTETKREMDIILRKNITNLALSKGRTIGEVHAFLNILKSSTSSNELYCKFLGISPIELEELLMRRY